MATITRNSISSGPPNFDISTPASSPFITYQDLLSDTFKVQVNGQLVTEGTGDIDDAIRGLQERVGKLEDVLAILKPELILEEKYPSLYRAHQEYQRILEEIKTIEALKNA